MQARTNAAFCTVGRGKTAIWPGDVVKYDIGGIYIWRPTDTALEPLPIGRNSKYLFKNPGDLNIFQVGRIAREFANVLGLILDMPVTPTTIETGGLPCYQLGEHRP